MKFLLLLFSFFAGSMDAFHQTRQSFHRADVAIARAVLLGAIKPQDAFNKEVRERFFPRVIGSALKSEAIKVVADEVKTNKKGVTTFQVLQRVEKDLVPARTASDSSSGASIGAGSQTSNSGNDAADSPRSAISPVEGGPVVVDSPVSKLVVGSVPAGTVKGSLVGASTPQDDEQIFASANSSEKHGKKLLVQTHQVPAALVDLNGDSDSDPGCDGDTDE